MSSKALVEVEIPDGWELADKAMRQPAYGESWLAPTGDVMHHASPPTGQRAILRPAWTWPAWLKAPWIAQQEDGRWFAFGSEPTHIQGGGWSRGGSADYMRLDKQFALDFTPPPVNDWRNSKLRNPAPPPPQTPPQ